jgi:hypothetical protein
MTRTIRANLNLTLDGRYHGAGGPADLSPIVPYAVTDVARDRPGQRPGVHELLAAGRG